VAAADRVTGGKARAIADDIATAAGCKSVIADVLARAGRIGGIHTPMLEAGVQRSGRTLADLDAMVPFGRIGKPDEVAALVAFPASDAAPFMCGALVEITAPRPHAEPVAQGEPSHVRHVA